MHGILIVLGYSLVIFLAGFAMGWRAHRKAMRELHRER